MFTIFLLLFSNSQRKSGCCFHSTEETGSRRTANQMSQHHLLQSPFSLHLSHKSGDHPREGLFLDYVFFHCLLVSLCTSTTISPVHQRTPLRKLTTFFLNVFLVHKSNFVWGTEMNKPVGMRQEMESLSAQEKDNREQWRLSYLKA